MSEYRQFRGKADLGLRGMLRRRSPVSQRPSCNASRAERLEARRLLSVTLPDDVNSVPAIAQDLGWFTDLNGTLLFVHNDGFHGAELYRSNGSAATTSMIRDINPAYAAGSNPLFLANVRGTVYFNANDGQHGQELWKSDGTPGGTAMVKDLVLGFNGSNPFDSTAGPGNTMLFLTNATGARKLWATDGASGGTQSLGFIDETNGRRLEGDVGMGDTLYYFVWNGNGGREVWSFDGLSDGPQLITTIDHSSFSDFHVVNQQTIVFTDSNARALWKSDGTSRGTSLVGYFPGSPTIDDVAGSSVFLTADDGSGTLKLWGWTGGTSPPQVIDGVLVSGNTAALNGLLYFRGRDGGFWSSDGTTAGTHSIPGFGSSPGATFGSPVSVWTAGDRIYFPVVDPTSGIAGVYSTDGSTAGTSLVKAFGSFNGFTPGGFTRSGDLIYFGAGDAQTGNELWVTDGSPQNTHLVKDIYPATNASNPSLIGVLKDRLYYFANDGTHGSEPWSTDGNSGGASLLKDLNPGTAAGTLTLGTLTRGQATSNYLFFSAYDGSASPRYQLWRTDGTADGTIKLTSFNLGGVTSFGVLNDTLYFTAQSPGLWTSDGTALGTQLISGTSAITSIAATMDGVFYCVGKDTTYGSELWRSDGTTGGTYRLTDLNPGAANAFPTGITAVGHSLLFFADSDSTFTNDLYAYTVNGGVKLVKKISAGNDYGRGALAVVGNNLFFPAYGNSSAGDLWVSDGTDAGTHIVGNAGTAPEQIFAVNGVVVFKSGSQLYRSDGTSPGTFSLGNMVPSPTAQANLANFCLLGNYAYFAATRNGVESIWRTDGTVAGTTMIADKSANVSFNPAQFATLGGNFFFNGDDQLKGQELWEYSETEPPLAAVPQPTPPNAASQLRLQFNRPLADDFPRIAFDMRQLLSNGGTTQISSTKIAGSIDPAAGALVLTFPGFPNGLLTNGNYRITFPAGYVHDASGNPLAGDFTVNFYALAGDANGDRNVGFADLVVVAQHYGTQTAGLNANGDFNGDGAVDFADLVVLAQNYGSALVAPTPSLAVAESAASISASEDPATVTKHAASVDKRAVSNAGARIAPIRHTKLRRPWITSRRPHEALTI